MALDAVSAVLRNARASATVARANLRVPERPDRWSRAMFGMLPWANSSLVGVAASAGRYPQAEATIDDDGAVTYRELWRRTNAIARGLRGCGASSGTVVGLLAPNGRLFVEAALAVAKTGADLVLLNTGFGGPQLADLVRAERIRLVVHDDGYGDLLAGCGARCVCRAELASFAVGQSTAELWAPRPGGRFVVLTSGTTGRPKGASRGTAGAFEGVAGVLARVPLRARGTVVVAAPLFHAWGVSGLLIGLALSQTIVVRRQFDPETTLADCATHRADALLVVPVMLQRILDLGPSTLIRYDTSRLRIIACSGSALPGRVVVEALHRFGPIVYNLYGSTEVGTATIATPSDLIADPTTAGRPVPGVAVRVVDDDGRPAPAGTSGRVFVGSAMRFEGYSGGGSKESLDGLLSSGDLGHFDRSGRLFIDGRDDDMIVSGGENVFPSEVEQLLCHHPAIAEVAVVGVPDERFGQALKAVVVRRPGHDGLDAEAVRGYVRERLARFKVPRQVEFVDALPRTPTGKVLKRSLG
jgi:fatty-acyl-CoA synthase